MINKEFTSREKGMIKNVAKAVYPMVEKKLKLAEKAMELSQEIEDLEATINKWEQGVMDLTGGFTSTELVKKEMVLCGEGDKAVRKAVYNFYYGENVLPQEETNPEMKTEQPDMTPDNTDLFASNNQ